jgi:hypothetical protein
MDQAEGRMATKPTNNKLSQFHEIQTVTTSLWVRMRRRRRRGRRRRSNNVGLMTREERKVYLWGRVEEREGRGEGERERERERACMAHNATRVQRVVCEGKLW